MITRAILLAFSVLAVAACQPGGGSSGYAYGYSAGNDDDGDGY